jgi:sulfate transport system permease protein
MVLGRMAKPTRSAVLPGFRLTLGFTIFYLCLIVLVPLMTLPARTATMGWNAIWQTVSDPRVVASYKLSVGAALIAAGINAVFGLIVAWVLARSLVSASSTPSSIYRLRCRRPSPESR